MKGYIFDLDGTLVDSMWVWEDLAAVYLQTKGIKAEENLSKELQLMTMTDAIRYLKEKYVIQDSLAGAYRGLCNRTTTLQAGGCCQKGGRGLSGKTAFPGDAYRRFDGM